MQRIIIKNFGAITYAKIDIKKFLVLIGEQGSGKSTVIKLISSFMWLEKDLYRSSVTKEESYFSIRFEKNINNLLSYHRIENYFREDTSIEYQGLAYKFSFSNGEFDFDETKKELIYPQISYIPAERNFISYVNNFKVGEYIPWGLRDFVDNFGLATKKLKQPLKLPIKNAEIVNRSDILNAILYLRENDKYNIKLSEASSGFQSVVPIILVSEYLLNKKITEDNIIEKNTLLKKKSLVNIVEEPEQNLFPISQKKIMESLVSICNQNKDNKLLLSTHSPYILTILNNLLFAQRIIDKNINAENEVSEIINGNIRINSNDFSAYVLEETENGSETKSLVDEKTGMIKQNYLDTVSETLGNEFNALYKIHAKTFQRK